MRSDEGRGGYNENNSDTESIGSDRSAFSGPLANKRASKNSARFNLPPEAALTSSSNSNDDGGYVEITLDIRDDSVAVHSVQGALHHEDPELSLLAKKTLEINNKSSSFRSSLLRNTSSHIKQVSQELKRFASLTRRPSSRRFDRTKSAAAHALKGLKFITTKTGAAGNGWPAVEKRYNEIAVTTSDGLLHCSMFGECIGTCRHNIFNSSGDLAQIMRDRTLIHVIYAQLLILFFNF